jgi:hypothetical protein
LSNESLQPFRCSWRRASVANSPWVSDTAVAPSSSRSDRVHDLPPDRPVRPRPLPTPRRPCSGHPLQCPPVRELGQHNQDVPPTRAAQRCR